jgi:phosphatidylserine decarboxylase
MSAATYVTAQLLRILPRARIGHAIGRLAERPWSPPVGRAVVRAYARAYDVALDEAAAPREWGSFDAFFTRKLRDGARLVDDDPRAIVSPADGRIEATDRIGASATFRVKGRPYSVGELVGGDDPGRRFAGGAGVVVYLSPRDYHRIHAPVSGTIGRIRSMPGDYYPVNAVGVRHVANLFCRNRRVAIEIDAAGGLGRVTVVMVVAMIVGRITTVGIDARDVPLGDHVFDPALRVERGQEIGVFHLGSTAVVLADARGAGAAGAWAAPPGPIRYGEPILRGASSSGSRQ